uniref:Secreted protein n=1 Tax=Caenorhabditis tropicalis TaxID=1561998 RepID=A0A1I7UW74_9PELO
MIRPCLIVLLMLTAVNAQKMPATVYAKVNSTATIELPVSANYRRLVYNNKNVEEEHLFRVCNGKNQKTCGFWENVKTKKKVASGATNYNKNKKALVIKKMRITDFGEYLTGNKKQYRFVMNQTW